MIVGPDRHGLIADISIVFDELDGWIAIVEEGVCQFEIQAVARLLLQTRRDVDRIAEDVAVVGVDDDLAGIDRDAQAEAGGALTGVFHCFTETAEVARAALDLGFMISFSGILTFKTAQALRDVAAFVPLDRCLIETDSPYLAPVPHRGKTNNPSYVPHVAQQIAEIKGVPVEAVAQATSANVDQLFTRISA